MLLFDHLPSLFLEVNTYVRKNDLVTESAQLADNDALGHTGNNLGQGI